MKKEVKIPLFWKFTIAIAGTVALFGIINLYLINYAVYDLFEIELTRHGKNTATSIAERSIDPIVYNDLATLNRIVNDQKRIDSTIVYIFILNQNNKVLAHTFEQTVPAELITANALGPANKFSSIEIRRKHKQESTIRDMAIPILDGNLGTVRIGLCEEDYIKSINRTSRIFLLMVILFLIFGIMGAFFFSYIITNPIKEISNFAKNIELDSLDVQNTDFETIINSSELVKWKNLLNTNDEIDELISSFGGMVSRLRNTYAELQKAQNSLFQSEKMAALGTLSAGLAHEINNPIAGMQSCIRRLKESPDNLKQNISYLELMEDAVSKIEKVVGGLLHFSRKPEMEFKEVNLLEIVESVLLLTAYRLEKSRITISKSYSNEPVIISASTNHMEQVVLNLVLNSIDAIEEKKMYEPEHSGKIHFDIFEHGNSIELEISDNGIGVPEDNLNDIFDPFFTHKKVRQGTGLGLSVCYSIVEQHKGSFRSEINKEGGLSIYISLPKPHKNKKINNK